VSPGRRKPLDGPLPAAPSRRCTAGGASAEAGPTEEALRLPARLGYRTPAEFRLAWEADHAPGERLSSSLCGLTEADDNEGQTPPTRNSPSSVQPPAAAQRVLGGRAAGGRRRRSQRPHCAGGEPLSPAHIGERRLAVDSPCGLPHLEHCVCHLRRHSAGTPHLAACPPGPTLGATAGSRHDAWRWSAPRGT
jgi:hypothetical protein